MEEQGSGMGLLFPTMPDSSGSSMATTCMGMDMGGLVKPEGEREKGNRGREEGDVGSSGASHRWRGAPVWWRGAAAS